jgi:hypothetical protein
MTKYWMDTDTRRPWPATPLEAMAAQTQIILDLFGPPPPEGAEMTREMVDRVMTEMHNRYRPLWLTRPCLN